ncbi:fibronectin type III domain-containing protein [Kibdelosporangium aridum]|uniref:Fibronectin type III domain-containing protein n=1 Tax=Kibdelosporangium aridum TaxID=2030 RepID=A0A428Z5D0_KIBAR|nr:fibronectin type III domain-containing protein [Kibdelosporangium aridum]RSM81981.1 fibronectin type III domain-containing protein [Kibdelosporangium aridum]
MALVVAGAIVGVLFGDGVARTVLDTSDGSTWLADDRNGDVVQVNPTTGKPEGRIKAGAPGSDLDVRQRDGRLVVINRATGEVTSIDLATLLASGRRQVTAGSAAEVLLDKNRMYILDREQGTITNVDRASTQTIGDQWRSPKPLTDGAVDGQSRVWALDAEGRLSELEWSDDVNRFVVKQEPQSVQGASGQSALVAHDRGVTVLGADQGVVVQVRTGNDRAIAVPGLKPPLRAADESPADLVPAAVENNGTVILVRADQVLEVRVTDIGCHKPAKPAVLKELVYVPCLDARKVIVLDRDGRRARADIVTPEGGEPELVVDDGRLVVNVPGATSAIVVEHDGSTRAVDIRDPRAHGTDTPQAAASPPPLAGGGPVAPPPPAHVGNGGVHVPKIVAPTSPAQPKQPQQPKPPNSGSQDRTETTPPPPPPTPDEVRPGKVTATARPDGSVLVTWQPGEKRPERYQVLASLANSAVVAQVPGNGTSAVVSTLQPGTTATFFVIGVPPGHAQGQLPTSQASNQVTTFTKPGAPTNIRVSRWKVDNGRWYAWVSWDAGPANGRPITSYVLNIATSTGAPITNKKINRGGNIRNDTSWFACDGNCALTGIALNIHVVAVNEAGAGQPGTAQAVREPILRGSAEPPATDPGDAGNGPDNTGGTGDGSPDTNGGSPGWVVPLGIPSLTAAISAWVARTRRRSRGGRS